MSTEKQITVERMNEILRGAEKYFPGKGKALRKSLEAGAKFTPEMLDALFKGIES